MKALEQGVVVCSTATFEEFRSRLLRPKFDKYLSSDERAEIISQVEQRMLFVPVTIQINACPDPDDNMFLELAITAGAECIVTGDKELLSLHPFREISIITSSQFLSGY